MKAWGLSQAQLEAEEPAMTTQLTPVAGAEVRYDETGAEIVEVATCGHCGRSWNDAAISSRTPVPSGRCPFEAEHESPDFTLISSRGSNFVILRPENDDALEWVERCLAHEETLWWDRGVIIECRYLSPILEGLADAGYVVA